MKQNRRDFIKTTVGATVILPIIGVSKTEKPNRHELLSKMSLQLQILVIEYKNSTENDRQEILQALQNEANNASSEKVKICLTVLSQSLEKSFRIIH